MFEAAGDDTLGYQCMDDRVDNSLFYIDGIDFAPVGADGACGIDETALSAGLQERIHAAVKKVYGVLKAQSRQNTSQPRVLVVIEGGVASVVSDLGVVVEIYDRDDAADDPEYSPLPYEFRDLAQEAGLPYKEQE